MFRRVDFALFTHMGFDNSEDEIWERFPIINKKVELADDLWIGKFDRKMIGDIMDACEIKGFHFNPTRQLSSFYEIVREVVDSSDDLNWDSDQKIQICLQLSRIVHPTSFGFEYSARVFFDKDEKIYQIIPGMNKEFGNKIYISDTSRDWLTKEECIELKEIYRQFLINPLNSSWGKAFRYYETAHRIKELNIRVGLICMGIEALIYARTSNQFKNRFPKFAKDVGISEISDNDAKEMYRLRSKLAHGIMIGDSLYKGETKDLYIKMETVLGLSIKRAILDIEFRNDFFNQDKVRMRLGL